MFITISTDCKALWITKRKVLYVYIIIIIIIVIIIKCDSVTYKLSLYYEMCKIIIL